MCILLLIGNIPGPSSSNVCISVNSHFSSASGRLNYQTRRMFIVIMSKRTWHLSFSLSHECNSFLIHNREKKKFLWTFLVQLWNYQLQCSKFYKQGLLQIITSLNKIQQQTYGQVLGCQKPQILTFFMKNLPDYIFIIYRERKDILASPLDSNIGPTKKKGNKE